MLLDDPPETVVSRHTIQSYPEHHRSTQISIPSSSTHSNRTKSSLHTRSDSDGESERLPVKPWSPTPSNNNTSSSVQHSNNTEETTNAEEPPSSPPPQLTHALRAIFEMITEDLDKFVYTPAPNGLGDIQCRITRDKRGMERGLYPTYYMHVERPGDGKKVRLFPFPRTSSQRLSFHFAHAVFHSRWSETSS